MELRPGLRGPLSFTTLSGQLVVVVVVVVVVGAAATAVLLPV